MSVQLMFIRNIWFLFAVVKHFLLQASIAEFGYINCYFQQIVHDKIHVRKTLRDWEFWFCTTNKNSKYFWHSTVVFESIVFLYSTIPEALRLCLFVQNVSPKTEVQKVVLTQNRKLNEKSRHLTTGLMWFLGGILGKRRTVQSAAWYSSMSNCRP